MKHASIKVNYIYTMCYEVLAIILPIITSPYVSRVLGAEGIGIYSYTYSISSYFVMFSMLGLARYGNRVIAKCRDDKQKLSEQFSNLYAIHFLVSVLVLIAYVGYFFLSERTEHIYVFIQGLYIIASFFNIDWFFFGLEEFKITVVRNTLVKIMTACAVFAFVRCKEDLPIYILILALGNFGGHISVWRYLKRYIIWVKPNKKGMVEHIKPLFVLFIPTIAINIYRGMDKIMLGYFCDKIQVGYYENADKMISIPMTIITAFGNVMNPRITYIRNKGLYKKAEEYMAASMKYIMMIAYALMFGIISVGDIFAPLFWGEEFTICGQLISLLAICIPFLAFASVIRTQYLLPESKDKLYNSSLILGAISNVIFNSIFIPKYGTIGAVYGTIIAEVVVCLVQSYCAQKELPVKKYFCSSIVFLIFGTVMYTGLYILKGMLGTSLSDLLILIVAGVALYMGMCLIYVIVTKDRYILELLRNQRENQGDTNE